VCGGRGGVRGKKTGRSRRAYASHLERTDPWLSARVSSRKAIEFTFSADVGETPGPPPGPGPDPVDAGN